MIAFGRVKLRITYVVFVSVTLQMMFFSFGGSILTLKHKICLGLSGLPMAVFWQCGIHVLRYEGKDEFRI